MFLVKSVRQIIERLQSHKQHHLSMLVRLLSFALPVLVSFQLVAQDSSNQLVEHDPSGDETVVLDAQPQSLQTLFILGEDQSPSKDWQVNGDVKQSIAGPRLPRYIGFSPENRAIHFGGNGARLVHQGEEDSRLQFSNGDSVTFECWVRLDAISTNANVYIIGKGRTGDRGFDSDNQNWAFRIIEKRGEATLGFLFATPRSESATSSHWHRWTGSKTFPLDRQWHHVAVCYEFGKPDSIVGFIDGKPTQGTWDMGGATDEGPVNDDADVWVGSSMSGNAGVSLQGSIDQLAIHLGRVSDEELSKRYQIDPKAPLPGEDPPRVRFNPRGHVTFKLREGLLSEKQFYYSEDELPPVTTTWNQSALLFDRLPNKYDDYGIRDRWQGPVLIQASTLVDLPAGDSQFILRVRGLSRLWLDGKVIARTKPITSALGGEEPITPVAEPPLPGARRAEHEQEEVIVTVPIESAGDHQLILETFVGGGRFRADPGESLVAVRHPHHSNDISTPYRIVAGRNAEFETIKLQDRAVEGYLETLRHEMNRLDSGARRGGAIVRQAFWDERHVLARASVSADRQLSRQVDTSDGVHPIDHFLAVKQDRIRSERPANSEAETAQYFHEEIFPILRSECLRCHGASSQSGIELNSRESVLAYIDFDDVDSSELFYRTESENADERMPPTGAGVNSEEVEKLKEWVKSGAPWPNTWVDDQHLNPTAEISDLAFARRAYFDLIGVPPTADELEGFIKEGSADKRSKLINRLLDDPRWADQRMGYWQDVLAENPTLINSSLNTTGPFRWYLYESFLDNKPMDRMVSELIFMRGDPHEGGSAGFAIAGNNQAPFAAKAQIVASAFLGIETQCARCHDAPYHNAKQRELFSLAAMLKEDSVTVPKSSQVPEEFFTSTNRRPLIQVTLKSDEVIQPEWPFPDLLSEIDSSEWSKLAIDPNSPRHRLAAFITSHHNERFAKVIANRVWRRLIGVGIVEPVDSWEATSPSHPELLQWLADEFVLSGYDLKHLYRTIMTSKLYQQEAIEESQVASPEERLFIGPKRRRLSAEQIIDSMFSATGKPLGLEELTFNPDGRDPSSSRLSLGVPRRAWMLANLANERDRPSLNKPKAMAVAQVMETFGWSGARQNPRTDREIEPNLLQPGAIANSLPTQWAIRVTPDSLLADKAMTATTPAELIDWVFLQIIGRLPKPSERDALQPLITQGFESRIKSDSIPTELDSKPPLPVVTWYNHLQPEASTIMLEQERRAQAGPAADPRFESEWRERYEDVIWSVLNLSDFVWLP